MFKAAFVGLALFFGAQSLNLKHNAESIDVQNLSNVQKQAGKFMKDKVPSIRDAVFGQGEQDNDFFKYQFVSEEAPMTVTQVQAKRVSDDEDAKDIKFKLLEAIQLVSGPLEGGKMSVQKKAYGIESFAKAAENLDWD